MVFVPPSEWYGCQQSQWNHWLQGEITVKMQSIGDDGITHVCTTYNTPIEFNWDSGPSLNVGDWRVTRMEKPPESVSYKENVRN